MRLARPLVRPLAILALLAAAAAVLGACAAESAPGWTFAPTPTPTTAAATPAPASGAPSAAPSGSASGAPSAAPSGDTGAAVVLRISAQGIAYDTNALEAPANTAFQIVFTNNDAGIPHNVAIHRDAPTGPEVWQGEIFSGVDTRTYDVPALPAGTYGFVCTVHPNMTGTLTVR